MKKRVLVALGLSLLLSVTAMAQFKVTGKVLDKSNDEPVIGGAVVVDGTAHGTVTSVDGSFSLDVKGTSARLVFSYLGLINQTIEVKKEGEATNLGTIRMESSTVGLEEVYVVASFAKDRQTPVALSNIKPELIQEKLGTQEFPEILKSTPSVYATKTGGGYGDSRINLRGFDSNNIGVLVNGVPVNDMENGRVYWSNWSGLSEVTQMMQVQRGLGASKLALSSAGGTINILTRSIDAEKGGSVYVGLGNDGAKRTSFNVSTGLMDNGWSVTLLGARNEGNGYITGTEYDAWTYFANISKIINEKHRLSFTAFGAPQWHNQRGNKHLIETFRNHKDGIRYNSELGVRNGETVNGPYGYNEYHKPQLSLNHYFTIDSKTTLSTAVYASLANGGGRRAYGPERGWLNYDYRNDQYDSKAVLTAEGFFDYDEVARRNKANINGAQVVQTMSTNSHDWYGILSTLNHTIQKISLTAGIDGRYYRGYHFEEIDDLLGGDFFMDSSNKNRPSDRLLRAGDKVSFHNLGEVVYAGVYGQAEYVGDQYSGFVSAAISDQSYRRTDYFQYTPGNQATDWINFLPWSVKAGVNYNISKKHNVYVNGGYFTRAPYFNIAFLNYTNVVNHDAIMEKVITGEVGYGYTSKALKVNTTAYWTNWRDRGVNRSFQGVLANIPGINARHAGIELDGTWNPVKTLFVRGMFSWGDWIWQDDVNFTLFDDNQNLLGRYNAYIGGVHVGNSAQMTAALGVDYEILPKLKLGVDLNYYGKNYADFDPTLRTSAPVIGENPEAWKMPDAVLVDLSATYRFKIGSLNATLYGKVNNLLNTVYVADALDGSEFNAATALVYYGFGTTWSTGLKVNF